MLVLLTAVVFQWILQICVLRYVWNNVIIFLFDNANINRLDYRTAGLLLLFCRIIFARSVETPYNLTTPCEKACIDACIGS